MPSKKDDAELYLQMYPALRKWINQCVICQTLGYDPAMPESIGHGVAARNLRRYFNPLDLNDVGLCEQCRDSSR